MNERDGSVFRGVEFLAACDLDSEASTILEENSVSEGSVVRRGRPRWEFARSGIATNLQVTVDGLDVLVVDLIQGALGDQFHMIRDRLDEPSGGAAEVLHAVVSHISQFQ